MPENRRLRFAQRRKEESKANYIYEEKPSFFDSPEFAEYRDKVQKAISKKPLNTREIKEKCGEAFNCLDAISMMQGVVEYQVGGLRKFYYDPSTIPVIKELSKEENRVAWNRDPTGYWCEKF